MLTASPLNELDDVTTNVMLALDEFREAIEVAADDYAITYTRWLLHGRQKVAPPRPAGMHPKAAEAIRDIVLDEIADHRVSRRAPRPTPTPTTGGSR